MNLYGHICTYVMGECWGEGSECLPEEEREASCYACWMDGVLGSFPGPVCFRDSICHRHLESPDRTARTVIIWRTSPACRRVRPRLIPLPIQSLACGVAHCVSTCMDYFQTSAVGATWLGTAYTHRYSVT